MRVLLIISSNQIYVRTGRYRDTLLHHLKRKILEAYFIRQLNPSLDDHLDSEILILFGYGVTSLYSRF